MMMRRACAHFQICHWVAGALRCGLQEQFDLIIVMESSLPRRCPQPSLCNTHPSFRAQMWGFLLLEAPSDRARVRHFVCAV